MDVLMITPEFTPNIYGGLGRAVTDLSFALALAGCRVHVVTYGTEPNLPEYEQHPNLYIHRTHLPMDLHNIPWELKSANMSCVLVAKALDVINSTHIDILHIHDWSISLAGVVLKRFVKQPLVTTVHLNVENSREDIFHYHKSQFECLIYASDLVIACSNYMRGLLEAPYHCDGRLQVIPNGVNLSRFPFVNSLGQNILFIGRQIPRKGIDQLIRAFALISNTVSGDLFIVGPSYPDYSQYLLSLAKDLDIAHRTHFIGNMPNEKLSYYFAQARVSVYPSLYEPFGIVALESMASGVPTIVSDSGGFSEIINDSNNGYKVPTGDITELANRILSVVNTSAKELDHVRKQARQDVEMFYTWDRVATLTVNAYEGVLQHSHA